MVGLRDIVDNDVLNACPAGSLGDDLCHALRVAIHRAVTDHQTRLCLIARQTVVGADNMGSKVVPHRTVGRADIVDLNASKLLQRVLHGDAILAHNVAVIAYHLHPERVAVDVAVNNAAVEGAEATEGIA